MKIKTFYAKSMAEAMQDIKTTLGADALLLSTKEIPSRSGAGGFASGFEVVAACDEGTGIDPESLDFPCHDDDMGDRADLFQGGDRVDNGWRDPAALTYSLSTVRRSRAAKAGAKEGCKSRVSKGQAKPDSESCAHPMANPPFADAGSSSIYEGLIASGIEEWLARKLVHEGRELIAPKQRRSQTALTNAIRQVAQGLIAAPSSPQGIPSRRVVVFVGPTGVGKTTSIAKLAARLALHYRKKTVLMTLDRYRIGAVEQLKTYAGLMGVPFRFVREPSDLPRVIRDNAQRDFILIDTTGRSHKDLDAMRDLLGYLKNEEQVDCHLVLSATTKPTDLHEIVDRFELCGPGHFVFTKLDETSTPGSIFNVLVRTHKPISYYSDGQRVPEDLHAAPKEQIVDILLNRN
jgi:flagellar biosynthesis protein FlhF